eukprot:SAG11_NODE_5564_length_1522_cov_1.874912_1_plen_239_part_00
MAHLLHSFAGDSFAIGQQHGAALAAEIRTEYEPALRQLAEARGETIDATLRAFAAKYGPIIDELDSTALDEVRGTAVGAELSFDAAFFAAYRDGTPAAFGPELRSDSPQQRGDGCTAVTCNGEATASGGVLIGQTKDTGMPLDRYRMQRIQHDSGRTHLLCNCEPRRPPQPPLQSQVCHDAHTPSLTPNPVQTQGGRPRGVCSPTAPSPGSATLSTACPLTLPTAPRSFPHQSSSASR